MAEHFSDIVKRGEENQRRWSRNQSVIYVKPGIPGSRGRLPMAPVTILGTLNNDILVERIARYDILHLVPKDMADSIQQDALALIYTNKSGERVWIMNEECKLIIGSSFKGYTVVTGRDRTNLVNLYQTIDRRTPALSASAEAPKRSFSLRRA